ncbi:unnamed protein product, partial [Phaeothamnion confervicola]
LRCLGHDLEEAVAAAAEAAAAAHSLDVRLRRHVENAERRRCRVADAVGAAETALLVAARAEAGALEECRGVAAAVERYDAALTRGRQAAHFAAATAAAGQRALDVAAERLEALLREREDAEARGAAAETQLAARVVTAEQDSALRALRRRLHCERLVTAHRSRLGGALSVAWRALAGRAARQRRIRRWWRKWEDARRR